jgi:hypothetical protein
MKGSCAAIAAYKVTVASTRRAVVVVLILKHESADVAMLSGDHLGKRGSTDWCQQCKTSLVISADYIGSEAKIEMYPKNEL